MCVLYALKCESMSAE